ncbi:MAG: hypothetical protein HBSIN02_14290 [Bacteroidia bacterium]|nr:MAG: hypothetical protein HBSIN02_14290 [Bacteroidia bacterium]
MPDPKTIMHRSIRQVETDLERIGMIVRAFERELDQLHVGSRERDRLEGMKEQLSEIRTRLEGLYAFVQLCEKKADRAEESEDVDVWM